MRFLRKGNFEKTVIVISDIHLGAGTYVDGQYNTLEDFHYDRELVEFLEYYSTGDYQKREVELIINGDLFDLLAVPYVKYFDDEFWSEEAALEKLKLILKAHPEVMEGLRKFLERGKNNRIVFIIGNHDAEFVFDSLQDHLLKQFEGEIQSRFKIFLNDPGEYRPVNGVVIKHGHEYEIAHQFHPEESIVENELGQKHFIPPWGSYYVVKVINKFKEERDHVNAVRPIKKFIINGLIYDTYFSVRFGLATAFYFIMVRLISFFKTTKSISLILKEAFTELELFRDFETLTRNYFEENEDVECLIVGHTHEAVFKNYPDGTKFINTGTWTNMFHLDFGKGQQGANLTFAQIDIETEKDGTVNKNINLYAWHGSHQLPFREF